VISNLKFEISNWGSANASQIVRAIGAAFLSFLLAAAPVVLAVANPALDAPPSACIKCSCPQQNCCVQRSAPDPQPVPTTPARVNVPDTLKLASPQSARVLDLPAAQHLDYFSPFSLTLQRSALPLYRRHCSLQI
jgi:hypothetical protein